MRITKIIKIAIKSVSKTSKCENNYNIFSYNVVNNAWNFYFRQIDAVIQVACVVGWTSIFTCQMIRVADFFYLLTGVVWCRLIILWSCCIPSIVLGSAISWEFSWPGVVYSWLLRLGPGPKAFQWRHSPY